MAKVEIHGISNCDTVRKARKWLDAQGIAYDFHDYKKDGADRAKLEVWADEVGWEILLNRRGTTFRKLPEAQKQDIDRESAIALMVEHPSLVKRPVLTGDDSERVLVGFTQSEWENALT